MSTNATKAKNDQPPVVPKEDKVNDTNKNTTESVSEKSEMTEAEKKKQERIDKMKAKASQATNSLIDPLKRLELFDSTKASSLQTKGTSSLGSLKLDKGSAMIMGRNVGAEQNEPDWSDDQMNYIKTMADFILPIQGVNDTRRSIPDPEMKFVGRDEKGSIVPLEEAYASNLDPNTYCIGVGEPKYDITGTPKFYVDAVIADKTEKWLLSQWTSEWVVIEGVAPEVLMKQNRNGASLQNNRRIGMHFARIGLPKMAFGPLFNTLSKTYPGILSNIVETRGYYWMNASWGVSSFSATFGYVNNEKVERTTNLSDVMRMLGGKSSLCIATVAISITCGSKTEGDKPIMDTSSYSLSVKLHNAFSVDTVNYHGPPQQGSTGMMIPSRFIASAKPMGNSATMGSNMSIFSSAKPGLFGTTTQPAVSVQGSDSGSYM